MGPLLVRRAVRRVSEGGGEEEGAGQSREWGAGREEARLPPSVDCVADPAEEGGGRRETRKGESKYPGTGRWVNCGGERESGNLSLFFFFSIFGESCGSRMRPRSFPNHLDSPVSRGAAVVKSEIWGRIDGQPPSLGGELAKSPCRSPRPVCRRGALGQENGPACAASTAQVGPAESPEVRTARQDALRGATTCPASRGDLE